MNYTTHQKVSLASYSPYSLISGIELLAYRPDVRVMPIYNGMNTHKIGPAMVGRSEVRQLCAVRIGPSGADEDGLDGGVVVEIVCKRCFHGLPITCEIERIGLLALGNEGLYFWERMLRLYVHGLEGVEGCRLGRGTVLSGGGGAVEALGV